MKKIGISIITQKKNQHQLISGKGKSSIIVALHSSNIMQYLELKGKLRLINSMRYISSHCGYYDQKSYIRLVRWSYGLDCRLNKKSLDSTSP